MRLFTPLMPTSTLRLRRNMLWPVALDTTIYNPYLIHRLLEVTDRVQGMTF